MESLEVALLASDVEVLLSYMHPNTLVVGPALEGHDFQEGRQVLRGRTCPWNTVAVWNVSKLSLIGFPLVGDGVMSGSEVSAVGGVEVKNL